MLFYIHIQTDLIQSVDTSYKCSRALKEVLFPGNSGYYAQTGGNLANLRYNTTIDKVTCTRLLFKAQINSSTHKPQSSQKYQSEPINE